MQCELIMIQMQEKQENELVKPEMRMRSIMPTAQASEQGPDNSTSNSRRSSRHSRSSKSSRSSSRRSTRRRRGPPRKGRISLPSKEDHTASDFMEGNPFLSEKRPRKEPVSKLIPFGMELHVALYED